QEGRIADDDRCQGNAVSARPSIFSELQRRNVLRAAVLYAGAVWLLAQLITRAFLVASAIGFPFWIAFAWFYEFTPQGLKRESAVASDASITRSTGRKLDKWIIAMLALAVVLLLANTFVRKGGTGLQDETASAIPAKSIAVLPFDDLSPGHDHGYFSAGLAEE